MPFGNAARGEFGTYFTGYARSPCTIEQMLNNMFIGRPPGNYDRLLDFSRAITGSLFFIPSATFLENVGDAVPAEMTTAETSAPPAPAARASDGSLRHRFAQRRPVFLMNNLHRELAPISEAAWADIEARYLASLKVIPVARRVVDVHGPGGVASSTPGHLHNLKALAEHHRAHCARSMRWSN